MLENYRKHEKRKQGKHILFREDYEKHEKYNFGTFGKYEKKEECAFITEGIGRSVFFLTEEPELVCAVSRQLLFPNNSFVGSILTPFLNVKASTYQASGSKKYTIFDFK